MPVWSEQERMIAESAANFFAARGGTDRVRRSRGREDRDRAVWQDIADQGWIGMLVSESEGGLGLGLRDALVLMREVARSLANEPLASAIAGAQALSALPARRETLLTAMSGKRIVLPAWASVAREPSTLNCESDPLLGLDVVDSVLLFDRVSNSLVVVDREHDGVVMDAVPTLDGGYIGRLVLKRVRAESVTCEVSVRNLSQDTKDTRLLLEAAELCGLGDEVIRRTRAYLETRKQFGVTLASLQAVQQRVVSAHVEVAAAEALVFEAAGAFEGPRQSFAARAAFYRAGQAAHLACREAIQFHGAIGFTDELDIGLYLKRCLAITAAEGGLDSIRASIVN